MDEPQPTPVAYAPPPPGATRRQFRLLLLLTTVNTALLGLGVLGPGLTTFAKQQWADYQQHRAARATEAAAAAVRAAYAPAQQQCLDHLDPPNTLLYAEDPAGVALLTAGGAKRVDRQQGLGWGIRPAELVPLPAGAGDPPCTANLPSAWTTLPGGGTPLLPQPSATLLFLHERHAVAGPRLVVVSVSCDQDLAGQTADRSDKTFNSVLTTRRDLTATVLRPATPTADAAVLFGATTYLRAGASLFTVDRSTAARRVTADYAGLLRLYAGQPDATDPARFHIPYQLDAHHGSIDGQLTADDRLRLEPDRFLADREQADADHPPEVPSPDDRRATGRPR